MFAYEEGKVAAQKGVHHFDNPYAFDSKDGNAWGSGWLVGSDPILWGDLESRFTSNQYTESFVMSLAVAFDLVTPWEAGRIAARQTGWCSQNPFATDTVNHSEWSRGFTRGSQERTEEVEEIELRDIVATQIPTPEIQVLPNSAFWAHANDLQVNHSLSTEELAQRVGVDVAVLKDAMVSHHFYDADAIPLGLRAAS